MKRGHSMAKGELVSEDVNDVIRAKRFELVNDEGQVRAVLEAPS